LPKDSIKDSVKESNKENTKECVEVAVGVVYGKNHQVLLARRPAEKHMGGLWEFPGGKVDKEETTEQALIRELDEELNITPTALTPLINIQHAYSEKKVSLYVYTVTDFNGKPEGKEGQVIKWVRPDELTLYDFPAANKAIISAILLPDKYAITGEFSCFDALISKMRRQLESGIRLIQFRANGLQDRDYFDYAKALSRLCHSFKAKLLIKDSIETLKEEWCDGVHLRFKTAMKLYKLGWCFKNNEKRNNKWLAVSCHSLDEVNVAEAIGAYFVTLSPVCVTSSHPDAEPLGFALAKRVTSKAHIPVYWLGGMNLQLIDQVRQAFGQGIGAISEFWSYHN